MTGKNKYSYRAKISEAKIRQIVRLFAVDLDASQIAQLTNLNSPLKKLVFPDRLAKRAIVPLRVSCAISK
mgnify:CR=1 FL=1